MDVRVKSLKGGYRDGAGRTGFSIEANDLVLPGGKVSVLEGGNGSGKSTFLKILSAHPDVHAENVTLEVQEHGTARMFYGAQRRHEALFGSLKVGECLYVASVATTGGTLSLKRPPGGGALLGRLPDGLGALLAPVLDARSSELSGGQRGLVVLAMTFIACPNDVLLLDEPDAGTDVTNRKVIADALVAWSQAKALPVVVATHHIDYISVFTGARLRASDGRVVQTPHGASS